MIGMLLVFLYGALQGFFCPATYFNFPDAYALAQKLLRRFRPDKRPRLGSTVPHDGDWREVVITICILLLLGMLSLGTAFAWILFFAGSAVEQRKLGAVGVIGFFIGIVLFPVVVRTGSSD